MQFRAAAAAVISAVIVPLSADGQISVLYFDLQLRLVDPRHVDTHAHLIVAFTHLHARIPG
jgi:hypothetical protein